MRFTKILGLVLLAAGLVIIGWTLLSSYYIFTGKAEAPAIFEDEAEEAELQKEMERMIGEQLKGLLPADTLPKLLNLAIWAILAWILIFGGAQISGLGVKLVKL